jgi:hypothetical protein
MKGSVNSIDNFPLKGSVNSIDNFPPRRQGAAHGAEIESGVSEAIYHVMNRGDRRELMYKDDADRQRFLVTTLVQRALQVADR